MKSQRLLGLTQSSRVVHVCLCTRELPFPTMPFKKENHALIDSDKREQENESIFKYKLIA